MSRDREPSMPPNAGVVSTFATCSAPGATRAGNEGARQEARAGAIDGLRGAAALAVVFYHAILACGPNLIGDVLFNPVWSLHNWSDMASKLVLAVFNGEAAVTIFFAISGAVLATSLRRVSSLGLYEMARFSLKRILRIYPALAICLVLSFSCYQLCNWIDPGTFHPAYDYSMLVHNLLLQNFLINGATWTLQAELLAIPFIIFAAVVSRRAGIVGLLLVTLAALLLTDSPLQFGALFTIKTALFDFMLGMVVASPEMRDLVRPLPKRTWIVLLVALLLVRHVVAHAAVSGAIVQAALAAGVVACLYHQDTAGSLLRSRTMLVLGRISYSLYLFNVGVMNLLIPPLFWWIGPARILASPLLYGGLLGLATTVCTLPIALAGERFIERPFIAFGRRFLGGQPSRKTWRSVTRMAAARLGWDAAVRHGHGAEASP
jgi:peptidoglycan/LPS O-acetylase OafA/YrhL